MEYKIRFCQDLRKINQDVRTRDKIPVSKRYKNCCSWNAPVIKNEMVGDGKMDLCVKNEMVGDGKMDLYVKNEMVPDGKMDLYVKDEMVRDDDDLPDLVSDDDDSSDDDSSDESTDYDTTDDGYGSDPEGDFRYIDALPPEDLNVINSIKEVSMISNREDNSYKFYLWGDVRSSEGGKIHRVKMMLDCGNLLPDAVAISKSFFLRSGLKLVSKKARRCTTAKTGGSITSVGIASPLCIRVPGISKTVEIQAPIILDGLSDEVNIGNKALQS